MKESMTSTSTKEAYTALGRTRRWVILSLLVVGCVCFIFAPAARAAAPADQPMSPAALNQLLDAMKARLGHSPGYRADFVQRRHLRVFMDDLVSTGTCSFAPPASFRWEVSQPYRSFLIVNGDQVGRFEDDGDGHLRAVPAGDRAAVRQMLAPMMAMMRGDFSKAGESFKLTGTQGVEDRIVLEPLDAAMRQYIQRIVVRVERKHFEVTGLQIQESGGDTTDIEFSNRHETTLDPRLFNTKTPQPDRRQERD